MSKRTLLKFILFNIVLMNLIISQQNTFAFDEYIIYDFNENVEHEFEIFHTDKDIIIDLHLTFFELDDIILNFDKVMLDVFSATLIGGYTERINLNQTLPLNYTVSSQNNSLGIDLHFTLDEWRKPILLDADIYLFMKDVYQIILIEIRGAIVNIDEYLTLTKEVTIIPLNNRRARIIHTDRFSNPDGMDNINFYYHFGFREDAEIDKASIVIEDMYGDPLTKNNVLMKSYVNIVNNTYIIDVESYNIEIRPRQTYWVSISYITSNYVEKEKSIYNLKKYISFKAESASVKLKLPLTNFISPSISTLKIQSVTPEPKYIETDDNYKILFWDKPATDISNILLFEVTIKYYYSINWSSIISYIFVLLMGVAITPIYKKFEKRLKQVLGPRSAVHINR